MSGSDLPTFAADWVAPAGWRCIDLISDVHLRESDPATFLGWRRYLETTPTDAVLILGDLFEVWIGDDACERVRSGVIANRHDSMGFEDRCGRVLGYCASRTSLHFLCGNRDFLVGDGFAAISGMVLHDDPVVLSFDGQRYLLTHGDLLCPSDTEYQAFRHQVRSEAWQRDFLARPLEEREAMAGQMREQSMARQREQRRTGAALADVDDDLARRWLDACGAQHLIHGHTHAPGDHDLGQGRWRHVLSDWDLSAELPRAQALRLCRGGPPQRLRVA